MHTAPVVNNEDTGNAELALLYRASEALNAAFSVEAILIALSSLQLTVRGVALGIFEYWDHRRGSHINLYAWHPARPGLFEDRRALTQFPLVSRLAQHEILIIDDTETSDALDETSRSFYRQVGQRALLTVSLHQHERCAGLLAFFSGSPTHFTDRDRRLAIGIGKLVFTALERIRLQKETETAWQRAELLAQIEKSLSRAGSEEDILDAVSLFAYTQGATCMALYYLDYNLAPEKAAPYPNATARPVAIWKDGECVPPRSVLPPPHQRPGIELEWWEHGFDHVLYVEDIQADARISAQDRERYLRVYGARSMIVLLLVNDSHLFAILAAYWPEPHHFNADERYVFWQLLQTLTSVIALRRAYLAAHDHGQQMQAVAKVSAAVTMLAHREQPLQVLSQHIQESFPALHFIIYLCDDPSQQLYPVAGSAEALHTAARLRFDDEQSVVARAARDRAAIWWQGERPEETKPTLIEMAAPIMFSDECFGVFATFLDDPYPLSASMRLALSALTDLIALSIQNARLHHQTQEFAVYHERNRLARQLHDSVSQSLYGISLGAHTARRLLDGDPPPAPARLAPPLDYIISLADAGLKEMRALIFDLRPDSLAQEGLLGALNRQIEALRARHQLTVTANHLEEPDSAIAIKEALYWVAREALHNVVKHAQATEVVISLGTEASGTVCLTVQDNGIGFDPAGSYPGHLGLRSMQERIMRLGGTFELTSSRGSGARLVVHVPPGAPADTPGMPPSAAVPPPAPTLGG